jgi:hypothetical protein
MGPLEQEIHDMTRAAPLPGEGKMNQAELFIFVVGHFNKLEMALGRIAREIDGQAERATASA